MKEKDISIVFVEPNKAAVADCIPNTLEDLQKKVGGYIEAIYPFEDEVALICNEEGKLNGSQLNRALRNEDNDVVDIIAGSFFVVGLGEEDFCSLTPEQIEKYTEMYKTPENFIFYKNDILAIPVGEHKAVPVYKNSFEYAQEHKEVAAYRMSMRINSMCKTAIESSISDNYSDNRLSADGVKAVVEMYGFDRVKYVLAATVHFKSWDERISPENKAWAKDIFKPNSADRIVEESYVIDRPHTGLTDIFIRQVRKLEAEAKEHKPSVLSKLEDAKSKVVPIASAPKKKEQVL